MWLPCDHPGHYDYRLGRRRRFVIGPRSWRHAFGAIAAMFAVTLFCSGNCFIQDSDSAAVGSALGLVGS